VLVFPVIFFVWPDLPSWPARLGPTYYVLRPVYAASVEGAAFADVRVDLAVAAAICAVLLAAVAAVGRWLELRLAAGRPVKATASD
jgi:ABC-2 type transport system permease protein